MYHYDYQSLPIKRKKNHIRNDSKRPVINTPVFYFLSRLPWLSKPVWIPSLLCFVTCVHLIPQITSGVTPAHLLAANMAAEQFRSMHLRTSVGGARVQGPGCLPVSVSSFQAWKRCRIWNNNVELRAGDV